MTIVHDIRKTVTDTTPVYAVVGATDLAVERLREARTRAAAVRQDLRVSTLQDKAVKRFEKVTDQAQSIPAQVKEQGAEVAGKARETYSELAVRGEKLVKRLRNQKSTQDLFAQAGSTVSLGKGAVTTVRKAAHDTQEAAKTTLATGRRQAGSVAASVQGGLKTTSHEVNEAAATTLAAAEGTATTAKKSTAAAQRATRSVSTSARKTAASATKAAKTATPKVGD
jgi:tartrate dehydratase beta subunit/fumarate hydratase class I family protein